MKLPVGVRLLMVDRYKLDDLWERLRKYCFYLGTGDYKDPVYFVEDLLKDDTVALETDYGILIARNIHPGVRAEVHVAFWDHKLSVHTEDVKDCLIWLFGVFNLRRVETFLYGFQHTVKRFLTKRLGFTREGRMRKRVVLQGQFQDIDIYSILREEVFE